MSASPIQIRRSTVLADARASACDRGATSPSSTSSIARVRVGAGPTALETTAIVYYGAIVVAAVVVLVVGSKLIAGAWASPAGRRAQFYTRWW